MNAKQEKAVRRRIRSARKEFYTQFVDEVKSQPLGERIKIAFAIVRGWKKQKVVKHV